MMNSLRAIGYSFEAALADIVDNSVAARAKRVGIQFRTLPSPYLAFIDDGDGMTEDQLVEAMRHGGVGPDRERRPGDLGRFGLGLKTATLSQCRRLTVVSKTGAGWCAARWDLDEVERSGDWALDVLGEEEASQIPQAAPLADLASGTVVIWEKFDRATAGEASETRALDELVDRGREHLGLVFHRYIAGDEGAGRLALSVNNLVLKPLDPFLRANRATQQLPEERLSVEGVDVVFTPYVLPHISKLTAADLALAGGEEGLRRGQGFYVYRNRRLITSGTWFRLVRQEELTKLARVRVDIPNSLDHLWALDVKKSAANPPEVIRTGLKRVVERIAETSRHVYRFRGRRAAGGSVIHVWHRLVVRGGVDYTVNRDHPIVEALRRALDPADQGLVDQMLRTVEMSLPTDALYADLASERRVPPSTDAGESEAFLQDLAGRMLDAAGGDPARRSDILKALPTLEPFSTNPTQTERILQGLADVD